jgi:FAD synthetase
LTTDAKDELTAKDKQLHQEALVLYEKLRSCDDGYLSAPLNSALDILMDALRLYGPNQLFASYNGGKDAVVILHLLRAVTAKYSEDRGQIFRPKLIYFAIDDEFKEVVEHIDESEKLFNLDLERCDCGIMKVP